MIFGPDYWTGTDAVAVGTDARVTMTKAGSGFGPDRCTYSPPPYDVMSDVGIPADPIVDFPVTT